MDSSGKEIDVEFPPYFTLYKDGSVHRSGPGPLVPPSPELHALRSDHPRAASKDVKLNPDLGLWARIFLPPVPSSPSARKLPIILYFHGGAFLFGSPAWRDYHDFCTEMALHSSAICMSANYRLSPEHKLPAAIEDGFAALEWLHMQSMRLLQQAEAGSEGGGGKEEELDKWLAMADFSKCFVAGESAGAIIAHHVAMRVCKDSAWMQPNVCIKGLILIHPAFMKATRSEEELGWHQDGASSWELADVCMSMTLPPGSSGSSSREEHPLYINPFPDIKSLLSSSGPAAALPSILFALAEKDCFHFVAMEYMEALKGAGCCKKVDLHMSHGVGHIFYVAEPCSQRTVQLMDSIAAFVTEAAAE